MRCTRRVPQRSEWVGFVSPANVIDVGVKVPASALVLCEHLVYKRPICLRLQQRQEGFDRLADITAEPQVEL